MRQRRRQAHLSQEELAARANLTQTYLSQLETGRRNPSILILLRLCRALRVPPADLLDFNQRSLERLRLE